MWIRIDRMRNADPDPVPDPGWIMDNKIKKNSKISFNFQKSKILLIFKSDLNLKDTSKIKKYDFLYNLESILVPIPAREKQIVGYTLDLSFIFYPWNTDRDPHP